MTKKERTLDNHYQLVSLLLLLSFLALIWDLCGLDMWPRREGDHFQF